VFIGIAIPVLLGSEQASGNAKRLNLKTCIDLALKNNNRSRISRDSVEMALAVHRQALSAYWPEVSGSILASRMDEDPNFLFPASQVTTSAGTLTVTPSPITLPANIFGAGLPPVNVTLPLQPMSIDIPAQVISVPQQNVRLMDRDNLMASIDMTLPLYTGGLRHSRVGQARAAVAVSRADERHTDLEVIYDIKRLYYALILSDQLITIGRNTLAQMEMTLELTEKLYQTGSGTVKKTDYLRNKLIVETVRSMVTELESKKDVVRTTLLMAIGLDMTSPMSTVDAELPFAVLAINANNLVGMALSNNPDIAKVDAAVKVAEFGIGAAKSGYLPKIALVGKAAKIVNSYDVGMVTPENKSSWMIGIGVDIPIFKGFRVNNEVAEQKANLRKLQHQRDMLKEGLSLQVRNACFDLSKAQDQQKSNLTALESARENRDLNVRAYQEELVETKEVIEAQIMEALLAGQYQKVLYDRLDTLARLEFLTGTPDAVK
jgi:outer membrane protein